MINENEEALPVDRRDSEVECHWLRTTPPVDNDPHIDVVGTHRLRKNEIKFVFADVAADFPPRSGTINL